MLFEVKLGFGMIIELECLKMGVFQNEFGMNNEYYDFLYAFKIIIYFWMLMNIMFLD